MVDDDHRMANWRGRRRVGRVIRAEYGGAQGAAVLTAGKEPELLAHARAFGSERAEAVAGSLCSRGTGETETNKTQRNRVAGRHHVAGREGAEGAQPRRTSCNHLNRDPHRSPGSRPTVGARLRENSASSFTMGQAHGKSGGYLTEQLRQLCNACMQMSHAARRLRSQRPPRRLPSSPRMWAMSSSSRLDALCCRRENSCSMAANSSSDM